MSDNGTPRILTLDVARRPSRKGNDFITVRHTQELIVEECKKVHEFYLGQIPNYVAKMTQDALLHYGLIKVEEPVDLPNAATGAVPDGEVVGGAVGPIEVMEDGTTRVVDESPMEPAP